jgi:hypothetical protein
MLRGMAGWVVGGLPVSFRFFAWDPHRRARTARGGKHHVPFGQIKKRERGADRLALAADRPAACLQGIEQHARLGGAHGKFRDADREAG